MKGTVDSADQWRYGPGGSRAFFLLLLFHLLILLSAPPVIHAENYMGRSMEMQVMVADPEHTADMITDWTERRGGYYIYKSTDLVVIRVPMEGFEELRLYMEGNAEQIVSVAFEAHDLRSSMVSVQSGIRSREEILERNLRYLRSADVEGTLAIEREITRLLQEVESLKGRLRRIQNDMNFALAEIHLSFMEQTLPQDIPSSFEWINSVDFYRFVTGRYAR